MKKIKIVVFIAIAMLALESCSFSYNTSKSSKIDACKITRDPQNQFYNLIYGLTTKINISDPHPTAQIKGMSKSTLGGFSTPTVNYVRAMGFLEKSTNDYILDIKIDNVSVNIFNNDEFQVTLNVVMKDESGNILYTQNSLSEHKSLNEAYTLALEQINWGRIASFLRVEKLAKNEPTKQVEGLGNTSLEQTIVRWDVQSRPQGADIFWRVVSKTPDVKSTNNKYLMTTPYEATRAIDIKGLTYQTSSNVRVVLRCEKDGYLPQEKEFDVRMILDQEEISAFFRLVKAE